MSGEEEEEIAFTKFNMREMEFGAVIAVVAKRASGKSWTVRDILSYYKDVPLCVVFSLTEKNNPFFSKFVPQCFVFEKFSSAQFQKLIDRATDIKSKNILREKVGLKPIDGRCIVVMDDILEDKSVFKDPNMDLMFYNGRHYGFHFIIVTQDIMKIPCSFRSQIDYAFILSEPRQKYQKKIYDNVASIIPDFKFFTELLRMFTDNFGCMVINNRKSSHDLAENVFHYRAAPHKNLKIGNKSTWHYNEKNFDKHYDERGLSKATAREINNRNELKNKNKDKNMSRIKSKNKKTIIRKLDDDEDEDEN